MVLTKKKVNMLFSEIAFKLAESIDEELYLPVKNELSKHNITHSLGIRKEEFKDIMVKSLNELRKELLSEMTSDDDETGNRKHV